MTEQDIVAFHGSFDRCMRRPDFFDVFYGHFLKSSPEVADKFRGTDFERQKRMLKASLYLMVGALVLRTAAYSTLVQVARRHARSDRDIPPHLYTLWLDSLVFAARTCDPRFTTEIEKTWRDAMQPGIDYLVSFY